MTTPTHPETERERPGSGASAAEIEADIARTREQLGHTVEELSEELDIKSRAGDKLQAGKHRAVEQARTVRARGRQYAANPVVPEAGAAIAAMGVAVVVMVVRGRSR